MTRAEKNYFSVFHLFILTPDPFKPQWKFWGDIKQNNDAGSSGDRA